MIIFVQVVLLCRYNEVSLTNNLKMAMVKPLGNSEVPVVVNEELPTLGIDSGSTDELLIWRTNQDD